MTTALDTNILVSIWSAEPSASAVLAALQASQKKGGLSLSPIAFVEALAHPVYGAAAIQAFFADTGIVADFEITKAIWEETALRFARYASRRRRSGGEHPRRIAADFLIGAHALMRADRLMTLDAGFYEINYPELELVSIAG